MISDLGRLLIVSPHADDAALSCAALLDAPRAADIVTVFTGDGVGADPERRRMLQIRRDEEHAAFGGSPHSVHLMDLPDPTIVGRPRGQEDGAPVARWIWDWSQDGGTVALPVGAGCRWGAVRSRMSRVPGVRPGPVRHADHLFLRDVGLDALRPLTRIGLLLYEELPYLWCRGGDSQAARAARMIGCDATLEVVGVDRQAKARRIAVYESQVGGLRGGPGRVDDPVTLPEVERYWWLRRAAPVTRGRST